MITIENISTGEVFTGEEIEFFIDDETAIGEVYIDGDLVYQNLDVIDEEQLEYQFKLDFSVLEEEGLF